MGPLKKRVLKVKQISCSPHASAQSNSFPFQGTRNFTPPQIQRDKPKDLVKHRRAETLFDRGVEYLFSMFILMPLMLSATTILGQTIVVYMNAATITCCRQTDISAMLQRVYWTSIFLYAVPLWITRAIMNQMVFVLNQRSGYILYPRWVAICLQIPAHLAPMALVALTCVTQDGWYACHIIFAGICFLSYLVYFLASAILMTWNLLKDPRRRSGVLATTMIYFLAIPTGMFWLLKQWRAGRGPPHPVTGQCTVFDPLCSQYEWLLCCLCTFGTLDSSQCTGSSFRRKKTRFSTRGYNTVLETRGLNLS